MKIWSICLICKQNSGGKLKGRVEIRTPAFLLFCCGIFRLWQASQWQSSALPSAITKEKGPIRWGPGLMLFIFAEGRDLEQYHRGYTQGFRPRRRFFPKKNGTREL